MATRTWLGNAVNIKQVDTVTIALTWAQNDTCTLTINGKDLVVTIGTLTTTSQVATTIKQAWENETLTDTSASFTPLKGGQDLAEFKEITASVSAAVVTLTADTAGKPFTLSVVESTAGTGTATEATSTSATGSKHFDNADNWSADTVPVDADTVVFDHQALDDCSYGLGQSAVTPNTIIITRGFIKKIGLAAINTDAGSGAGQAYDEYRNTYLALGTSADATDTVITIGGGSGNGSGRIKLDSGSGQVSMQVLGTGVAETVGIPAFLWKGTHASNVADVIRGDVGVAFFDGESATIATLKIGFVDNILGDATVVCGDGTTLTTIDQSGGTLTTESAATTVTITDGELTLLSGAHTTINIDGGTVHYRSTGTIITLNVSDGGLADFSQDMQTRTVNNCVVYTGASIRDPFKTVIWTNGIDVTRCKISDLREIDLGNHITVTPSAV